MQVGRSRVKYGSATCSKIHSKRVRNCTPFTVFLEVLSQTATDEKLSQHIAHIPKPEGLAIIVNCSTI